MNQKAQTGGKKAVGRSKLPVKRTINLAGIGEKPIKASVAIPAIILILIAAALLSKFFVYDRLAAMTAAQREARAVQSQLDDCYERMEDYGELSEVYAHYTYSGMTEDELSRADRVAVVTMIDEVVQPRAEINAWTLAGNQVSLTVTSKNLEEVNGLVNLLEQQKWVSYCTVSNATATDVLLSTGGSTGTADAGETEDAARVTEVTSHITIFLKTQQEVNEE